MLKLKGEGESPTFVLSQDLDASALLSTSMPPKSCHDLKVHIGRMRRHGVAIAGVDFDSMLAGFLVNPGKAEPSLLDLYHEHLAPLGGSAPVGSEPEIIAALRNALTPRLVELGLDKLYGEIELPLARVLADMESFGIGVDAAALSAISAEFGEQLVRLERECYALAGHEFNLNSPIQLRDVLFANLNLSPNTLNPTNTPS